MRKTFGGEGEGFAVAEIQGLYGPFSFPEKLLQQIWMRGEFDARDAFTADGRRVDVVHPGRWNLLGGPDFQGARLRIGGVVTTGDVELHLHAADWRAHGHAGDPAYDRVILHVVLFPNSERLTAGANGREIPVLTLLPLLHHDLEEYAADAAVERLANHPLTRANEALAALSEADLRAELTRCAMGRWHQKVRYAKIRIDRLGWAEACHQTALEILGYRANRAPMLALAATWPLSAWTPLATDVQRAEFVENLFASPDGSWQWSVQGIRPANQPRTRLRQYATWTSARPGWPARWAGIGDELEACLESAAEVKSRHTTDFRKLMAMRCWREKIAGEICGQALSGPRLDTLICDGFLPLLGARASSDNARPELWWRHWYCGDVPAKWLALLRALRVIGGREWPASHGAVQGLLGWMLTEEKKQNFGDSAEGRGT